MDKAIVSISHKNEPSIFNYIDMNGIRTYLINYPHLLAIIEFLFLHIDDFVKNSERSDMTKSSHI